MEMVENGTSHGNMGIYSGNIIGYIPIYCLYISPLYPTISISIYIYRLAVYLPVSSPWLENPRTSRPVWMISPARNLHGSGISHTAEYGIVEDPRSSQEYEWDSKNHGMLALH